MDSAWNLVLNILFSLTEDDNEYFTTGTKIRADTRVKTGEDNNVSDRLGRSMHMPQLELFKEESVDHKEKTTVSHDIIEPAFLHSSQYPTGWLIFDPKLGLVRVSDHSTSVDEQNFRSEISAS
jgi:hypothetical protein